MKTQNALKNLDFFGAMAIVMCLAPLTTHAKGTSHGNSTDGVVPYVGFKAVSPSLDSALVIPQTSRNFNRPEITDRSADLPELENIKLYEVPSLTLFAEYGFPKDRSALDKLYLMATQMQGDYSRLSSAENPFSSFLGNEYYKNSTPLAERLISEDTAIYPFEEIPQLGNNLRQETQITVNSQMTNSNCKNCNWTDYEPIPNGGITLEAYCQYQMWGLDSKGYATIRLGSEEPYPTGARIHISSQSDQIAKSVPLLPRPIAERLRIKSCDRPEVTSIRLELDCEFRPVTESDTKKLKKAFNLSALNAVNKSIVLKTFTNKDDMISTGSHIINGPLQVTYGRDRREFYRFSYNVGGNSYVHSEAELAELIRVNFIRSYDLLKNEPIQTNSRFY
ncbi:MAG: hypothetical protein IPK04_16810 [Bdellovibrionales bacterium]|nr:hypothetical protein [Bdellovibrionales bacterium]